MNLQVDPLLEHVELFIEIDDHLVRAVIIDRQYEFDIRPMIRLKKIELDRQFDRAAHRVMGFVPRSYQGFENIPGFSSRYQNGRNVNFIENFLLPFDRENVVHIFFIIVCD